MHRLELSMNTIQVPGNSNGIHALQQHQWSDLFSKLNKMFLGHMESENSISDNKNNIFSGLPNRCFR